MAGMLEVRNLSKHYRRDDGTGVHAVDDVSLSLAEGEFVSVIGPSGRGKSTLFSVIGGLVGDYEGDVVVDGQVVRGTHRDIGMVFQEESTFPWRTTLENVAFPLEVAGMPKAEREEMARRFVRLVGLEGFEDRYPSELSGGMKQRTAIARTLAFSPKIMLMDEPFGALDEQTRMLLGDKILQIWRELKTDRISFWCRAPIFPSSTTGIRWASKEPGPRASRSRMPSFPPIAGLMAPGPAWARGRVRRSIMRLFTRHRAAASPRRALQHLPSAWRVAFWRNGSSIPRHASRGEFQSASSPARR